MRVGGCLYLNNNWTRLEAGNQMDIEISGFLVMQTTFTFRSVQASCVQGNSKKGGMFLFLFRCLVCKARAGIQSFVHTNQFKKGYYDLLAVRIFVIRRVNYQSVDIPISLFISSIFLVCYEIHDETFFFAALLLLFERVLYCPVLDTECPCSKE